MPPVHVRASICADSVAIAGCPQLTAGVLADTLRASARTRQLSRELLPAATRRENQELKTDAPSGHGLAAALGASNTQMSGQIAMLELTLANVERHWAGISQQFRVEYQR